MKCSVVIPTYKRPQPLLVCVRSLLAQSLIPQEIIIVDDEVLAPAVLEELHQITADKCTLVYYKKNHDLEPRGSATSRNIGVKKALHDIVYIFDDDLVLESEFIASTMAVWEMNQDSQLIAVGGVISNNRVPSKWEKIYHRLGGLGDMNTWDINAVGFQSWNDGLTENTKGHYAHGGVCSYKKCHFGALGCFATFQGGRTALEDVEFFLRAKLAGLHTVVVPKARVRHDHSPLGRENEYAAGYQEGFNRVQIYKDHSRQGIKYSLWFIWANATWTMRKIFSAQFYYAGGTIFGLVKSIS